MTEYTKEIYPLKNVSNTGVQHYGYIILKDTKPFVRQWHMPGVMGYVFMTEDEANQGANKLIASFNEPSDLPTLEPPEARIAKLEKRVLELERLLK